jgi:chromosome partitioning protein
VKVLAIEAQKGGSGKTTTTVHLGFCAVQRKLKTAIIDVDPQKSAWNWNKSRPEKLRLDITTADADTLLGKIAKARAGGIDLLIIDTPPHSDSLAALVAQEADFVLIPCRPARFDLDAITSTVDIARVANTPAAIVINAAPRGRLVEDETRRRLTRQHIAVLPTVIHQRVAYSHAVIDGRSVHEYEPEGKAAAEIDELYNHITRLLGDTKKRKGKAA